MDLREIRRIIELVESSGIDELEIEEGGTRIRVRKGGPSLPNPESGAVPIQQAQGLSGPESPVSPSSQQTRGTGDAKPTEAVSDADAHTITSPMVGTFYRAPSPEAPPFVQIGSVVDPDSVVCILEAMKVMNEIKAGCRGKILETLVEDAQPVEFGQPLFKVSPTL